MQKKLTRMPNILWHYRNDVRFSGPHEDLRGDCSGLRGDCSGLRGDCTGLRGDLDACAITDEDRKTGVRIEELVASEAALAAKGGGK